MTVLQHSVAAELFVSRFHHVLVPICIIALAGTVQAQSITGIATAIDGDTLDITGQQVRIYGIDAPELGQTCQRDGNEWPCGTEARDQLASVIHRGEVRCEGLPSSAFSVIVARCKSGGSDLGEAMVAAGLATATSSDDGEYSDIATRVEARKIGIWAGTFDPPAQWRKAHPEAAQKRVSSKQRVMSHAVTSIASAKVYRNALGCAVKGNYSRLLREYIYYLPGMNYYDGTRPEILFCTEAEAQAAGFRRSRGG